MLRVPAEILKKNSLCLNCAAEIGSILESGAEIQERERCSVSHIKRLSVWRRLQLSAQEAFSSSVSFYCINKSAWNLICICSCLCAFVGWCIWRKQLFHLLLQECYCYTAVCGCKSMLSLQLHDVLKTLIAITLSDIAIWFTISGNDHFWIKIEKKSWWCDICWCLNQANMFSYIWRTFAGQDISAALQHFIILLFVTELTYYNKIKQNK